ncbi:MAG: MlaD family protein [Nocardioides sp.]|jgi:phospholipid/cholesterol/gamma-HCH transport system substrate-binding protein
MILDKKTSVDLVRLAIFMLVTSLATGLLVILVGNLTFGSSREYRAVFSDATGVVKGDDVRVAGVKVGSVKEIEVFERTRALITFDVADTTTISRATTAQLRFRNLVGQRYLSLSDGIGDVTRLQAGATIPLAQTEPALDLTVLFNGFKPLFQALSPKDVNTLSYEIIQVFQGEGGTLEDLLQHTASVTQTLASRDQIIGDLIRNLNKVLVRVGRRDKELGQLIASFRRLVGGLKKDRYAILDSLDGISSLSVETAQLVAGIREPFTRDIKQLRVTAANLDKNKGEIDRALQVLPIKLEKVGRTATYGSWFNFYLCQFQGRVTLPTGQALPVSYNTGSDRCSL